MYARTCNDPEHEARRAELRADREYGTPCLVCGAPVLNGIGHDAGCMAGKETHAFRAGSESYGQAETECFYCWRHEDEHDEQPLELHGLLG